MKLLESANFRRLYLILGFVVFVMLKWQDIALPYFWDEMAGYMSGVVYMNDHGISLLPTAVPPDLSYGHPLLLHASMACVAEVFGNTPSVMHITTLAFTFILALGTYFLALELSAKPLIALFSYTIFLFQPITVAQSTQVLLEVFLALHTVYALLFYIRKQYALSAFFTICAVMTKETGLVLAIAMMMVVVKDYLKDRNIKQLAYKFVLFDLPFMVFAAFLILQKAAYGWYLNPTNVGKSKLELSSMVQKFWDYPVQFSFVDQGRIVFTLVLIIALFVYLKHQGYKVVADKRAAFLLTVFVLGFSVFSVIADAHERYFLSLIPLISIAFAWAIVYVSASHSSLSPFILVLCLNGNVLNMDNGYRYRDADLSYRDMVSTNQSIFNFVNSGQFADDTISWAFPLKLAPVDKRYGYFDTLKFVPDTTFRSDAPYKVYCTPGNIDWNPPDTNEYQLIQSYRSAYSGSYLYKKF